MQQEDRCFVAIEVVFILACALIPLVSKRFAKSTLVMYCAGSLCCCYLLSVPRRPAKSAVVVNCIDQRMAPVAIFQIFIRLFCFVFVTLQQHMLGAQSILVVYQSRSTFTFILYFFCNLIFIDCFIAILLSAGKIKVDQG